MNENQLPQLLDFLQQAISCCRSNSAFAHVPDYARNRLRDAGDNVEFFMHRREYARAFEEARLATGINAAIVRFIQSSAEAATVLQNELGDEE